MKLEHTGVWKIQMKEAPKALILMPDFLAFLFVDVVGKSGFTGTREWTGFSLVDQDGEYQSIKTGNIEKEEREGEGGNKSNSLHV